MPSDYVAIKAITGQSDPLLVNFLYMNFIRKISEHMFIVFFVGCVHKGHANFNQKINGPVSLTWYLVSFWVTFDQDN